MEILKSFISDFYLLLLFALVFIIRNYMVYRYRMKALTERNCYECFKGGSYTQMLFDFRKWKFNHFYPKITD
jgi:hypothetical protein